MAKRIDLNVLCSACSLSLKGPWCLWAESCPWQQRSCLPCLQTTGLWSHAVMVHTFSLILPCTITCSSPQKSTKWQREATHVNLPWHGPMVQLAWAPSSTETQLWEGLLLPEGEKWSPQFLHLLPYEKYLWVGCWRWNSIFVAWKKCCDPVNHTLPVKFSPAKF
jgi:hypothetical protein